MPEDLNRLLTLFQIELNHYFSGFVARPTRLDFSGEGSNSGSSNDRSLNDQGVPQTPSSVGSQPFAAARSSIKGPAPPIPASQTNRSADKSQQVNTTHSLSFLTYLLG